MSGFTARRVGRRGGWGEGGASVAGVRWRGMTQKTPQTGQPAGFLTVWRPHVDEFVTALRDLVAA